MKKYTARKRKEALAAARDQEIVEMVHAKPDKNSALVKARAALAEKRAATKAPAHKRMAFMIPKLVDLTLALRAAGCKRAICTFADGSQILLR